MSSSVALVFVFGVAVSPFLPDRFAPPRHTPAAEPSAAVVMPDTGVAVSTLVEVVRSSAAAVAETQPDVDLDIVFTGSLAEEGGSTFLAGKQQGSTVMVRLEGVAMPTRTLVHELAHALTPGTGHGDRFQAVYLAAIAVVYDDDTAEREARRLAWVYDRCYLDDTCPRLSRAD